MKTTIIHEKGGKILKKNAVIWYALKLVITIANYSAYKYQLFKWENEKPKKKRLEMIEL